MQQLLALFLFVGFISCGSATTVKGTFATSYSEATVVAVSTNSPGTIIGESKVAADGSFSLALNQDSAKTFFVLVPTSGSFILVAFNGDGKTVNKLNIAANKGTFDLGTITVTNGRAHAALSASAVVLINANDNPDDDVLADVLEPVKQKFPNQQLGCTVWSTQPKEGETVQPGKPIKLRFTQAIDKTSFFDKLTFSGAGVDKNALGAPSYAENDFQVMFNPSPNLAEGSYVLTLPTTVKCASQTALEGEFKLQFTTRRLKAS